MENISLVVVEAFRGYKRGDRIDDPQVVAEILGSENSNHVVKTAAAPQSAPAASE